MAATTKVIEAPRSGLSGEALLDKAPLSVAADRIVPKRKCLDRYQPLEEFPTLWERFARIEKREDAIRFVRTFGPLSQAGLRGKGDIIYDILREAESMRRESIGPTKLYAKIDNGQLRVNPAFSRRDLSAIYEGQIRGPRNRCPQCNPAGTLNEATGT